jgi:UDP-N-acetyl-D-glucosamine dehydrogenase
MADMSNPAAQSSPLETLIASRQARIGIIGMGYVGLPLALLFSEQRFQVTGFDVDARKV